MSTGDGLDPKRRQILDELRRRRGLTPAGAVQTPSSFAQAGAGEDGATWPLAYTQERFWFFEHLDPDAAGNQVGMAVRLRGPLDLARLIDAFREVMRRHPALRVAFAPGEGEGALPVQRVQPVETVPLPVIDFPSGEPPEEGEARDFLAHPEAARPFDLREGGLFRPLLFREGAQQHVLVLQAHHAVCDGASMELVLKEVAALYRRTPLAPLPLQYGDFVRWQRAQVEGGHLREQLDFWKSTLGGVPALELPTVGRRPAVHTSKGGLARLRIGAEIVARVDGLARQEGTTRFAVLLAAYGALLGRYSGQELFAVGVPVAGRVYPELAPIAGCLINTAAIPIRLHGEPSFRELVRRVRAELVGALQNQDVPFEQVVEAVNPPRDPSRPPIYQVVMTLTPSLKSALALPGVGIERVPLAGSTEAMDQSLCLEESDQELTGALSYNSDLFDSSTAARMVGHLVRLLEALVGDPERPVSAAELLSAEERRQVLVEWNGTANDFPKDKCIHQLFEEQAAKTPEAAAVVFERESLTYRQLDERANQLAHHLRRLGVGPEVLVGLCVERSLEMVVGLLGILKAGGAYVPLDPSYPQERLSFMVADSGVKLLLTQAALAPKDSPARVVCLDTDWPSILAPPATALGNQARPESLAYVIYTSGSTGTPKGVGVPHRALANHASAVRGLLGLEAADRVLQFAAASFDVAAEEIFPSLAAGAAVVLRPSELAPDALARFIEENRLTVVNLPAAFWQEWVLELESVGKGPPGCLRLAVVGSEAVSSERLARWVKLAPEVQWLNGYGPTEATVSASFYRHRPGGNLAGPSVPIGRPVANARLYVLDRSLGPCIPGTPGELYISGVGVARGYLGRPSLTAERFVPDPFSPTPGARMYRTGDVARLLPDGNLEYLGRADFQVKLRGFRIELGEVESALLQQPSVAEAVVAARDERLVAYVVSKAGRSPAAAELREALEAKLPSYMVPSAFVFIEALPLTPSGKVDRKALPAPDRSGSGAEYVAPRTSVEETLCAVWAKALGVDRVGVEDDFFALGGHSLLTTRVVAEARRAGIDLSPAMLFAQPTVSRLARAVQSQAGATAYDWVSGRLPPIRPALLASPPLSIGEERILRLTQSRLEQGSRSWDALAVMLEGPLDLRVLEASYSELLRRHDVLRSRYSFDGGSPEKCFEPPAPAGVELVDCRGPEAAADGRAREHVARLLAQGYDLTDFPLIRAVVYRLEPERHVLVLLWANVVMDHHSRDLLISEWRSLYEELVRGGSPSGERPRLQYADFAVWQREWLAGPQGIQGAEWWKRHLDGAPPLTRQLPTDHPRVPVDELRAKRLLSLLPAGGLERRHPAALGRALRALAKRRGASLFSVLASAFGWTLARWSSETDVVLSCYQDQRVRNPELEGMIGHLTSTSLFRFRLDGCRSPAEAIEPVRREIAELLGKPDLPLVPVIYPSINDMFRVVLNVVEVRSRGPSAWGGCQARAWDGLTPPPERILVDLRYDVHFLPSGELRTRLAYNRALWSEPTLAGVAEEIASTLESIAGSREWAA